MSITKVLADEEKSAEEKLEYVKEVVAKAREAYGNADAEFAVPNVNTSYGNMPFDMLEPESQVEFLKDVAFAIKAKAIEFVSHTEGANLNRKIEELLATNPMFANISDGEQYDYL